LNVEKPQAKNGRQTLEQYIVLPYWHSTIIGGLWYPSELMTKWYPWCCNQCCKNRASRTECQVCNLASGGD